MPVPALWGQLWPSFWLSVCVPDDVSSGTLHLTEWHRPIPPLSPQRLSHPYCTSDSLWVFPIRPSSDCLGPCRPFFLVILLVSGHFSIFRIWLLCFRFLLLFPILSGPVSAFPPPPSIRASVWPCWSPGAIPASFRSVHSFAGLCGRVDPKSSEQHARVKGLFSAAECTSGRV